MRMPLPSGATMAALCPRLRAHQARRLLMPLLLAPLLLACTRGPDKAPLEVEIIQTVANQIKLRRTKPPQRPPVTRAVLDALDAPYIEVTIEDSGVLAYLSKQLVKTDGTLGEVTQWVTEDAVTLALRQGALVATRGLRNDLLSASALVSGGSVQAPSGTGQRRYHIAALDNRSVSFTMACAVSDLGLETIEIIERSYQTRHLQERCEASAGPTGEGGSGGVVVNDYWVDSRSGRLWQSRQWAGPTTGYLRIRQLTI